MFQKDVAPVQPGHCGVKTIGGSVQYLLVDGKQVNVVVRVTTLGAVQTGREAHERNSDAGDLVEGCFESHFCRVSGTESR